MLCARNRPRSLRTSGRLAPRVSLLMSATRIFLSFFNCFLLMKFKFWTNRKFWLFVSAVVAAVLSVFFTESCTTSRKFLFRGTVDSLYYQDSFKVNS